MRRTSRPCIRAAAALCACLLLAPAGAAAPEAPPPLREVSAALIDRLDDPSWEVREAASEELLTGADGLPAAIAAALPDAEGRPEVRARLIEALHHHFVREFRGIRAAAPGAEPPGLLEQAGRAALRGRDPGSLGVSHQAFPPGSLPGVGAPSIAVVRTLPGFPAHGRLRPGDLITGLDGRPVAWPEPVIPDADARRRRRVAPARGRVAQQAAAAAAAFSAAVKDAGAGSSVRLRVLRGGRTLEVPVTLARAEDLRRLYPSGLSARAEAAWRERLAGLGLADR